MSYKYFISLSRLENQPRENVFMFQIQKETKKRMEASIVPFEPSKPILFAIKISIALPLDFFHISKTSDPISPIPKYVNTMCLPYAKYVFSDIRTYCALTTRRHFRYA